MSRPFHDAVAAVTGARSLLFVPGDRPDLFAKASATAADLVIIDLEDAVAASAKETALECALEWLASGHDALVRVNAPGTTWHSGELAALAATRATVMIPKAESASALAAAHAVVGARIVALVETASGLREADQVCSAPGVVRIALGNVDLAVELGVDSSSHRALAYARGRLVAASAAAGLAPPIDGVTTAFDSPEVLSADLEVTRELGFGGKLCIHPRQVDPVNIALSPTPEELSWAHRVVAAGSDTAVGVLDGAMVDAPVVARARQLIARGSAARDE